MGSSTVLGVNNMMFCNENSLFRFVSKGNYFPRVDHLFLSDLFAVLVQIPASGTRVRAPWYESLIQMDRSRAPRVFVGDSLTVHGT